jgi:ABC-type uncharacterized transport system substrate-binding protein
MTVSIARRKFIAALRGATVVWPLAARAQQPAMPVIGFLTGLGRNDRPSLREGFRRGLGEGGYVEGRNLAIEYRFAENQYDQLPALAADLVGRRVAPVQQPTAFELVINLKTARQLGLTVSREFLLIADDVID